MKKVKLGKDLEEDIDQVTSFLNEVAKGFKNLEAGDTEVEIDETKFKKKALGGGGMTRRTC